jgi:hypothetical protein
MRGTTSARSWLSAHTSERPFSRLWMFDGMTVNNDHLNRDDKESGSNDHGLICAHFKYRPIKAEAREI